MNELYLMHFGIKGQKWGVRRYQNEDGTLTTEGKNRYGGSITKNGKYRASNGVVIGRSRNKAIGLLRRMSVHPDGKLHGGTTQSEKERDALTEYYNVGGDKMLDKAAARRKLERLDNVLNSTVRDIPYNSITANRVNSFIYDYKSKRVDEILR